MNGIDKRDVERFRLSLQARLTMLGGLDDRPVSSVSMRTKNISSSGAFFVTDVPFGIGTLVDVDLSLPLAASKSKVQVKGKVIRRDPGGMAVRFSKQYQIKPGG